MSKSSPSRCPRSPACPARAGAQQYSASTKRALVDVAEELFTEHGYAATSLDAIVAGAEVTKGALYHHFSGKQALFEAVFERVETDAAQTHPAGAQGPRGPVGEGARRAAGVPRRGPGAALPPDRDPGGPAVLGYERYREQEERSTFANVLDIVRAVLSAGAWELDEDDAADLRPDLLRGDVVRRASRSSTAEDPTPPPTGSRRRSGSSSPGFQALADAGVGAAGAVSWSRPTS